MGIILIVVSTITIPLIFLIYGIMAYKKKIIICTINNNKMKVVKNSYYSLQLLFCIINCILLVFVSLMITANIIQYVCYYIATFWLMNYLFKFISIKMNYVSIGFE